MSFFVLISQTFIAIINGKINLKKISLINIVTAITTLIASYPLLMLGSIGVSLLTGFGSLVGSLVGLFFIIRIYKEPIRNIKIKFVNLYKSSTISIWLTLHPIIVSLLFLIIPIIVNDSYGMESLGLYSSTVVISSVLTMVLMSTMKTYFLPSLGRIKTIEGRVKYIEHTIFFLLVTLFPLILIIMFFSENVLLLLFSSDFTSASKLLELQVMSVLLSAFVWPYAYFLLHNGEDKLYFSIDFIWVISVVLLLWVFVDVDAQLDVIPQVFIIGSLISSILYLSVIWKKYGSKYISLGNIFLSIVFMIALVGYYFSVRYLPIEYNWGVFFIIFIGYFLFIYRQISIKKFLN
jgi:O-antigen/teichoic acid export membrane protein